MKHIIFKSALCILLVFLIAFSSSCNIDNTTLNIKTSPIDTKSNFIQKILDTSSAYRNFMLAEENPLSKPGAKFEVTKEKNTYHINAGDGKKLDIKDVGVQKYDEKFVPKNKIEIPNEKYLEIKRKLQYFIKNTDFFTNKDQYIDAIENMKLYFADFDGYAYFSQEDMCIYIAKNANPKPTEFVILHELVHGLANITYFGQEYKTTYFNEALTDIITISMNPILQDDPKSDLASGYMDYYQWLYCFINLCGEEKVLESYFYGYDKLNINKDEFDLFVLTLEQDFDNTSLFVLSNLLLKWDYEKNYK